MLSLTKGCDFMGPIIHGENFDNWAKQLPFSFKFPIAGSLPL